MDGEEDMFKMFSGDYAEIGDGLPQSANGGFNFDDFDVSRATGAYPASGYETELTIVGQSRRGERK